MPSERKIQIVKNLKEKLARAKGVVLTNYQGLPVPEVEELRRKLSEVNSDYQVVKNTLLRLALQNSKFQNPNIKLEGPTAVLINYKDGIAPLKTLSEFAGEHEAFEIKSGFFDGVWQTAERLLEIAKLPSREELRAKVVRMLQSPMNRFANVAKTNQIKLVGVLRNSQK